MARTRIPDKVKTKLWMKAGGRCEYPGCNVPLWEDDLTLTQMNRAYIAHIIADSMKGPRGESKLSEKLAKDFSNLMLLCDTHHRLIDKDDIKGHPPELLYHFKREHEERIERLTGIQPNRKTYILMFSSNIGYRRGLVTFDQARQAILPERYPSTRTGIKFNLIESAIRDDDPEFWSITTKNVTRQVETRLREGPDGKPIHHLSIFALAPIPALIYFGKEVGDLVSADVYQRHRDTEDWTWKELKNKAFDYEITRPAASENRTHRVALNLSLSGAVQQVAIDKAIDGEYNAYRVTIARPNRNFLRSSEQLELFSNEFRGLLSDIRDVHGEECEIHLFPAVPNAIAVQIGRLLLPKSDPPIHVYDYHKRLGGFNYTLTV